VSGHRDDETLRRLEAEIPVPDHAPPDERVAVLRAAAEARRAASIAPRALPRRGFLLAGVGAAAGAAAGIGVYEVLDKDLPSVPTERIALTGAPAGVSATGELINHTWGIELLLTIGGLDAGSEYRLRYRATDERVVDAGSFVAVADEFLCRMTGSLLREDAETIELLDADDTVVVRATL